VRVYNIFIGLYVAAWRTWNLGVMIWDTRIPQDLASQVGKCFAIGCTDAVIDVYADHSFYYGTQLIVIDFTLSILKGEVVNSAVNLTWQRAYCVIENYHWIPYVR